MEFLHSAECYGLATAPVCYTDHFNPVCLFYKQESAPHCCAKENS